MKLKNLKPILLWSAPMGIIFIIAGLLCFKIIFSLFEPTVQGITFEIISKERTLKTSVLFAIVMGFIPIITSFTWTMLSLTYIKRYVSALIITGCISFAIFARHEGLKHYFRSIVKNLLASSHTFDFLYPIDPRYFVYYIICGFVVGCMLSCLLAIRKRPGN